MALSYAAYGVVSLLTVSLLTSSVSCQATELDVYKQNSTADMDQFGRWIATLSDVGKTMNDSEKAKGHLKDESCRNKTSTCCKSLESAEQSKTLERNCKESGLWAAECYALFMYTDEVQPEFLEATRKGDFETYKVLDFLINCAVIKLSSKDKYKVKDDEKLFRDLNTEHRRPDTERIFWKAFASASLSQQQVFESGYKTRIEFEPKAAQYGVKVQDFSKSPDKEEVLISPFETYDVLKNEANDPQIIRFRSSEKQEFGPLSSCKD